MQRRWTMFSPIYVLYCHPKGLAMLAWAHVKVLHGVFGHAWSGDRHSSHSNMPTSFVFLWHLQCSLLNTLIHRQTVPAEFFCTTREAFLQWICSTQMPLSIRWHSLLTLWVCVTGKCRISREINDCFCRLPPVQVQLLVYVLIVRDPTWINTPCWLLWTGTWVWPSLCC